MRITFKSGAVFLGCTLAVCGLLTGAGCGPPGPRALLQGEQLIKEGKYEEAQTKLKVATTLIPQNAQAWNHLGMAYQGSKMYLEAAAAYEQALKLNRDLAAAHYNLGNLLLEMGNPAAAQPHLTTYTLMQPRMSEGWFKLGVAQMQLRQKEAKMSLDQALALNATHSDAWNTLGLVYMQQNRPRDAMSCYENALKYQTNHGAALLNQAIVLHQYLKNRPLALAKYGEYLANHPTAPDYDSVQAIALQLDAELKPANSQATNTIGAITIRSNATVPSASLKAPSASNVISTAVSVVSNRLNAPSQAARQLPDKLAASNSIAPVPPANAAALSITLSTNRENARAAAGTISPATSSTNNLPATNIVSLPAIHSMAAGVTNLAGSSATNRAVVSARPPKAVESVAPTNQAGLNPPPSPVAETLKPDSMTTKPIEDVTRLEVEPPIQLPGDDVAAMPSSATPAAESAVKEAAGPEAPSANSIASSPLVVRQTTEKRSLLQKANPANWFRSKTREKPSAGSKKVEAPVRPADDADVKTEEPQPVTAPVIARYPYRNPPKPASGDATAAKTAMTQAYRDLRAGKWNLSVDGFKKAVSADPACFEARLRLALAAYQSSSVPEALLEYENALAIDPASFDARFNFAVALQKANYPRDAASELEKLQTAAPKDARVQLFLANIYARQLRVPQQARAHYLRVLELEPQHPEASAIRYWLAANP